MIFFPAATIKLPAPMASSQTKAIMKALEGDSADPTALFVGGCVRNALINRPVDDIDIATLWTPPEVTKKLTAAGIKAVPTGIDHGTITAVTDGKHFEITTLRRDVSTDGRRAVVAFTKNWEEDARRRDFTFNTLLADSAGNVYDPTGRGISDLRTGRVIFVGDAAQRIAEDYLRILRFFRFHATYGSGPPDLTGLIACHTAAGKISTLSRERITQEFFKILSLDDPTEILKVMFENNVLSDIAHTSYDVKTLNRLCSLQKQHSAKNVIARIVLLCALKSSHINILNKYFALSREQSKLLGLLLTIVPGLKAVNENSMKAMIYRYGHDASIQSVLLFSAHRNTNPETFFARVKDWQAPALPISGDDVMKAGVNPGPAIGKILTGVENWWIENNFTPAHDACMKKMKELTGEISG